MKLYQSILQPLAKHGRLRLNLDYNQKHKTEIELGFQRTSTGWVINCSCQTWFDTGFSIYDLCLIFSAPEFLKIHFTGDDVLVDKECNRFRLPKSSNSHSLKHFELAFYNSFTVTNEGFRSLTWFIMDHLPQLQILNFSFERGSMINSDFMKILNSCILSRLKKLKTINLRFSNCDKLTDEGICSMLSWINHPFQTLKTLGIAFIHCDRITDAGIKILGCNISNPLETLETIKFQIKRCARITDMGINEIKYCLENSMNAIKCLDIKFEKDPNKISDEGFWEPPVGIIIEEKEPKESYYGFDEARSYMHDYDLEEFSDYDYGSDSGEDLRGYEGENYQEEEENDDEGDYEEEDVQEYFDQNDFQNFDNNLVISEMQE